MVSAAASSSGRGGRLPLNPFALFLFFICFETNWFVSGKRKKTQYSARFYYARAAVFGLHLTGGPFLSPQWLVLIVNVFRLVDVWEMSSAASSSRLTALADDKPNQPTKFHFRQREFGKASVVLRSFQP